VWGKPLFTIADNCAVDVKNLAASAQWYKEKLKLRDTSSRREDDSERPFVDLCVSTKDVFISLIELPPGRAPEKHHVIFWAKNLDRAHEWFASQGIATDPITTDSAGNRLFQFYDVDGNAIEVCVEP
jgi:catechol 2,3-dioxygenase-like lactoylglutathione lyase family enzyme